MSSIKPLDQTLHQTVIVQQDNHYPHMAKQHIAPLVLHEYSLAQQDYPIVFVKDTETGQFRSVALLGLQVGVNVFYSDLGWQADYIPEIMQLYPFALSVNPDGQGMSTLCLDFDSPCVSEVDANSNVESQGQRLFNDDGSQTEFTQNIGQQLVEHHNKQVYTDEFIQCLIDHQLLLEQTLSVKLKSESFEVSGIYIINESALNDLSESDFIAMRQKGYLVPIYAALMSLSRMNVVTEKLNLLHESLQ